MPIKIAKGLSSHPINVTPMIDVIFQLLLFVMVASQFTEEDRSLPIALPQAGQAIPLIAKPKDLFVNVDQNGRYFTSGAWVSARQLENVLRQASANNPGRQSVVVRADKRCIWQHVVQVLDLCNRVKIRDYRVTTAPPTGSS